MADSTGVACAACGVGSTSYAGRFCQYRCWRRAKARRSRGVPEADPAPAATHCRTCGGELPGTVYGGRHCSDACYQRARNRERLGVPVADAPVPGCERCGKPVGKPHWTQSRWCSANCASAAHLLRRYHEARPVLDRDCAACGQPIPAGAFTNKRFCDRVCRSKVRNPEVVYRYINARRLRLVAATVIPIPRRSLVRLRRGVCSYCPAPADTIDHVVPLARGGRHAEGNLAPACRSCNSSKGDKLLIEWRYHKAATTDQHTERGPL